MVTGSIVALVTPMHVNGDIDQKTLCELIEWHIACKTDGIVAAGTTGECSTLTHTEQLNVIQLVIKQVAGRVPVIAGTGTNATHSTLALTREAKALGADASLIVTPYYNRPTQRGLYEHYKTIAEQIDLPHLIYNVPARTSCDILPETVCALALLKNIAGIKEATGKIERTQAIVKNAPADFMIYSGDDATALDLMRAGAKGGVISVTANIAPELMHEMCAASLQGNAKRAQEINTQLMGLHTNLFLESNPIPAKWALHHLGKIPSGIRLPLLPLDNQYHNAVKEALHMAGVA